LLKVEPQEFLKFYKELTNMTRETGDTVKLKCEVYGVPAPRKIRWYKNEVPVDEERGKVFIRNYNSPPPGLTSSSSAGNDEEAEDYYDDDGGGSSVRRSAAGGGATSSAAVMQNFRGSRLRIVDLEVLDSGFYKCEVTNGPHRISSTGIVVVKRGSYGEPRYP
jgi:receptor tyrosine kinase-like orphan receptor 1